MGQTILPQTDPVQNLNQTLRETTNNEFSFTLKNVPAGRRRME